MLKLIDASEVRQTPAIAEFFRLLLPKTGGGPIDPLTFIFFTNLASSMAVGSVTIIDQARNVMLWEAMPDWNVLGAYLVCVLVFMMVSHRWFVATQKGFADVL